MRGSVNGEREVVGSARGGCVVDSLLIFCGEDMSGIMAQNQDNGEVIDMPLRRFKR